MDKDENQTFDEALDKEHEAFLEEYLAICKTVYEQMQRDGTWPWEDSPKSEDVIDSKHNSIQS